jgi:tetrahydrodipicolinate N-succinyltransferase
MPVTVEFGSNVGTSVEIGGGVKVAMSTARMGVFVGVGVYESFAANGEQAERKIPSTSRLISFFMTRRIIRVSISRSIVS